jgi:hypothetical protein
MNLQTPDRVPVMCQLSFGHMVQQLRVSPVKLWFDLETFAQGLVTLRDLYQFDGILVSLFGHYHDWAKRVEYLPAESGLERVRFRGEELEFPLDDLPTLRQSAAQEKPSVEDFSPEDLPDELYYIPVSLGLRFYIDRNNRFGIFTRLQELVGETYSLHGEITSPFDYLLDYLGYEEGLIALIEAPGICHQILERFTLLLIDMAKAMSQQPIDAIKLSSPFAGMGFISPEQYGTFVLPYEKQICEAIRSLGKFVYLHTCGGIKDRLELMQRSGTHGLECLDPPPLGNVTLEEAVHRIGTDVFIKGNLDSVNILLQGSEEEFQQSVRQTIQAGKHANGFILSTACSVAPHVKRERLQQLVPLAEVYGRYG